MCTNITCNRSCDLNLTKYYQPCMEYNGSLFSSQTWDLLQSDFKLEQILFSYLSAMNITIHEI